MTFGTNAYTMDRREIEHHTFGTECGGQGILVKHSGSAAANGSGRVEIIGRLYQGIKGHDHTNWLIPAAELKKFDLVGRPFYWEHSTEIGVIESNWVDDNNWLWIKASLHPAHRIGDKLHNYIREGLVEGRLKQLSISWEGGANRLGVIVGPKQFKEASLVEKGYYSNTDIFSVQASANQQGNVSRIGSQLTTTEGQIYQLAFPEEVGTMQQQQQQAQQPQQGNNSNINVPNDALMNTNQSNLQTGTPLIMQQQHAMQQQQQQNGPLMSKEKAEETFGLKFTDQELTENRTMDQMYKLAFAKSREENIRRAAAEKQLIEEKKHLQDENGKFVQDRNGQIEAYKLQQQPLIEETSKTVIDHLPHGVKTAAKQLISEWGTDPTTTGYVPWKIISTLGAKLTEQGTMVEKFKIDNETLKRQLQDHQTSLSVAAEAASKNRADRTATGNVPYQTQSVIETASAGGNVAASMNNSGGGRTTTMTSQTPYTYVSTHEQRFMPIVAPIQPSFDSVAVEKASKTFGKTVTRDSLEYGLGSLPDNLKGVMDNEEFLKLFQHCNQ